MGNQNVCPSRLFIALNSNCYLASKKRHQHRGVDLKNPLHKSRCTFQKMFSVGLYLRERAYRIFSDMNLGRLSFFFTAMNYCILHHCCATLWFSTTHQLYPLTWFCWIIWTGTKVGFLENTMMTLFFLLVPIQNYRIFFFVKASCFEKDLVLPWLREINPRERAEEVMLSASNCSLFFLAKQSILVEFMSDSEANRG